MLQMLLKGPSLLMVVVENVLGDLQELVRSICLSRVAAMVAGDMGPSLSMVVVEEAPSGRSGSTSMIWLGMLQRKLGFHTG